MRLIRTLVGVGSLLIALSRVTQAQTASLQIVSVHTTPFTQGDGYKPRDAVKDAYTLTVTNVGAAATTKPVIVTDILPFGLSATAISGGPLWDCRLDSLSCVRRDPLGPGASYQQITVSVNVSGSAPASVSNTVYLSSSGEVPVANRMIVDLTPINGTNPDGTVDLCTDVRKKGLKDGYNVLTYYARNGVTSWHGIRKDSSANTTGIGPFMPTIHTKDQIMVEVCGLRFDTAVNVSLASIAIPEQGADIRGATPTQTTATVTGGSTTDVLQAAGNATNSAIAATLPSTQQPSGLATNTILTLGGIKSGTYTSATIQATAEDFARAIQAYHKEEAVTLDTLRKLCLGDNSKPCPAHAALTPSAADTQFGSVAGVYAGAKQLHRQISDLANDPQSPIDTGAFDEAKAKAQQFAVVLASLDSQISAASFGTRVSTLAANYRAIAASLSTEDDLFGKDQTAKVPGASCPYIAPSSPKAADLSTVEYCNFKPFHDALTNLGVKINSGATTEITVSGNAIETPATLYGDLANLRDNLEAIDLEVSASFEQLNEWYERSSVVYTDILTPSTTNLVTRVGINATETFVPFTLSFPTSSSTSANGSPTTTSSAVAGHFESSTPIEVERIVHTNLVGGVLLIHVPTTSFSFTQSTVALPTAPQPYLPCGGTSSVPIPTSTPPTYYCSLPSVSKWQIAGFAAINIIPFGRNYFPQYSQSWRPKTILGMFGVMVGSSVTSLGTGFGGLSLEPVNGIDIYGGIASAHTQKLPNGVGTGINSNVYLSNTQTSINSLSYGFAAGVGFDLSVFTQIFKSTSAPAAP